MIIFYYRDAWQELRSVEDRFRKAMIANAQLDNDKAAASYQLQLHKDRLEDLEEAHSQLQVFNYTLFILYYNEN